MLSKENGEYYLFVNGREFWICDEAAEWIIGQDDLDIQGLWDVCNRPDWMFFLLRQGYRVPDKLYREMAYEFAVRVVDLAGKNRDICIDTLDVVSDFIDGTASKEELRSARASARDAARDAAWDTANYAARDAAWASARDTAWDTAWDAAWDAARDTAWDAAWDAARADIIRHFIPTLSEVV